MLDKEDIDINGRDKPSRILAMKGSRKMDTHWRGMWYKEKFVLRLWKLQIVCYLIKIILQGKIVFHIQKGKQKTFKTLHTVAS